MLFPVLHSSPATKHNHGIDVDVGGGGGCEVAGCGGEVVVRCGLGVVERWWRGGGSGGGEVARSGVGLGRE